MAPAIKQSDEILADDKEQGELEYASPFERMHADYVERGFHVLAIGHGEKRPCYLAEGAWKSAAWKRYVQAPASKADLRRWARWRDTKGSGAGIGLAMGTPAGRSPNGADCITVALDFDPADGCENAAAIMAAMVGAWPAWGKIGNRGGTMLVRMLAAEVPTGCDYAGPGGKLQLIRDGQTVVPPSIHPTTGAEYRGWTGTAPLGNADELPLVSLAELNALMAQFEYARSKSGSTISATAYAELKAELALSDARSGLIAELASKAATSLLGDLWRNGAAAARMQTTTNAGGSRDLSGSGLRLELAKVLRAAGYNVAEFCEAVVEWPPAYGAKEFGQRDMLRAWGASVDPMTATTAAASNFPALANDDGDDAPGAKLPNAIARERQGDLVARYAAEYPKVAEGGVVKVALTRALPSGAVVTDLVSFGSFRDFRPQDFVQVQTEKGSRRVHAVDLYRREDTPILSGVRFMPGLMQSECRDHLNTWRGWPVQPTEAGSCELFKHHLLTRVCSGNIEPFNYLWLWCAHMVQKPREKPGAALVIQSAIKGSGKSFVGEVLGKLVAPHYVAVKAASHVLDKFNAHLADALLLQIEEAVWARDPKGEGVLKSLITENMMVVERKGIDAVTAPSYCRVLFTSNEKFVVPATEGERRFLMLKMTNSNIVGPIIDGIMTELRAGGYGRLMFELLAADLTGFNPMRPPHTKALDEQIEQNQGPIEAWYSEMVEDDGGFAAFAAADPQGRKVIPGSELRSRFKQWQKGQRGSQGFGDGWAECLNRLGFAPHRSKSGVVWELPRMAA